MHGPGVPANASPRPDDHRQATRADCSAREPRRDGRKLLLLAAGAAAPLLATLLWRPPLLLLWNASASAPMGLYALRSGARIGRGDMVAAFAPARFRALASARGYLPAGVPLVKGIAALPGDEACACGAWLLVNGRLAARRLSADLRGRRIPWWHGCRRLRAGEYLLLSSKRGSFDGRYFGPIGRSAILGKAVLLWRR